MPEAVVLIPVVQVSMAQVGKPEAEASKVQVCTPEVAVFPSEVAGEKPVAQVCTPEVVAFPSEVAGEKPVAQALLAVGTPAVAVSTPAAAAFPLEAVVSPSAVAGE